MRYSGLTFRYIFKNFIFVFPFALIPSFFFALSTDIRNIADVASGLVTGQFNLNFGQLFKFFSLFAPSRWPFALTAFIFTILFLSMFFSMMEKHMRIGKRSFRDLFRRIDYNVGSTLFVMVLYMLFYEFWALVTAGAVSLIVLVVTNGIARCVLGVAISFIMISLSCYLISLFILWLPCRQITGYSFMDSLSYSSQLSSGKRGKIFLSVWLPYLVILLLQGVIVSFSHTRVVVFLCIEILFIFMFMYYGVLMYVMFFDANGEERMDLKKKY